MRGISPLCQELVRAELRRRAPMRGMTKRVAYDLRTSQTQICAYLKGTSKIPEKMAWRVLAQARREDLELADKIEAELLGGEMLKEGA